MDDVLDDLVECVALCAELLLRQYGKQAINFDEFQKNVMLKAAFLEECVSEVKTVSIKSNALEILNRCRYVLASGNIAI